MNGTAQAHHGAGRRLALPSLGIGCGSLAHADGHDAFGAMLAHALDGGIDYFDTAALYLGGESERRLGDALRGRPRGRFVVSTKVGRYQDFVGPSIGPGRARSRFDYSADATLRSVEASLARLRLDRLDLVMIHDVSRSIHGDRYEAFKQEAMTGAYEALLSLRRSGVVGAIGVAAMDWRDCLDLMRLGDFDAVMPAGEYTLLHRACEPLLAHCAATGAAFIAASPFNSGILATGAIEGTLYDFAPATPEILAQVERLDAPCRAAGIPLAAAALQFPGRHPAVSSVVVGCRSAAELERNRALLALTLPDALWAELDLAMTAWRRPARLGGSPKGV
jgi:D-threo-aldose 1-dehydrogenase